jgi:hypothetical protein
MSDYSFYGYLTASIVYLLLLPGLFFNRKNNPFVVPFVIAAVFSFIWAALTAYSQQNTEFLTADVLPFETLRNGAWFFLLGTLLSYQRHNSNYTLIKTP